MASLLRAMPLVALLLVTAGCEEAGDPTDDESGGTLQREAVIHRNARVVWSAEIDPSSAVTSAVVAGDWVLVATTNTATDAGAVIGFDDTGRQWWDTETGSGDPGLTVLADGLVRECAGSNEGDVLDRTTGDVIRTGAECPEAPADDVYAVEESELVVYDDIEHSHEKFRIALRDHDAVAFAVEGGVVTFSADAQQVRSYR
ncbi:hypothetical protein F0U44_05000 [Nocardioides humilatus]|uniref:META domain-containing protein n=1 Tax=Nocardioides humilatus TaxID=2607660 RepID=A0A5B1LPY8_9ACTN|nr:hypothetical protein [Nocardioides humilatus]KAA1421637.1 hypothetical protein F0U44_05000 [Nocardioides humilatus]